MKIQTPADGLIFRIYATSHLTCILCLNILNTSNLIIIFLYIISLESQREKAFPCHCCKVTNETLILP